MGFHLPELVIIGVVILALFGPKTLQSMARNAGKGMREASSLKNKVLSELPMEEISKVKQGIPLHNIPLNSKQVMGKILSSELNVREKAGAGKPKSSEPELEPE